MPRSCCKPRGMIRPPSLYTIDLCSRIAMITPSILICLCSLISYQIHAIFTTLISATKLTRYQLRIHSQVNSLIVRTTTQFSGSSCLIYSSLWSPNVPPIAPPSFPANCSSGTSFSHGFLRLGRVGLEAWSVRSVSGISRMPGMGAPVWISWTICAKVGG